MAYTEINKRTGKMNNRNKRHTGEDEGRQGSSIEKGGPDT